MERRPFGRTDMQVHPLGLGGAEIGYAQIGQEEVDHLIGGALDHGCNVIDTAAAYAESEARIGHAIAGRREETYVFTKVGPDWSSKAVRRDIERSLRRLRCEYVDLLQIWSAPLNVLQRGEIFDTLDQIRADGLARYIGYSGDSREAKFAVESGRIDALQTSISVADQEAIELTLPTCAERGIGVIAKRPLANAVWLGEKADYFPGYGSEYARRLDLLDYSFTRRDNQDIVATALRFTLSVPGVSVAIAGTKRPGRWEQNAALLEAGLLSEMDYKEIRNRWKSAASDSWRGQR